MWLEQLVEQVAKPALEDVDLGFGDRNICRPVVADGPGRKIMRRRAAREWPRLAEQLAELFRR